MRTDWHASDRTARRRRPPSHAPTAGEGAPLVARLLGLALLAGAFALVALAPQAVAQGQGPELSVAQPADVVDLDPTHGAALISDQRAAGGLPFARVDVAILLFGGAIITVAAAAAPFLFGPLRLATPLAIRAAGAAEPLVAAAEQAAPAHAPA